MRCTCMSKNEQGAYLETEKWVGCISGRRKMGRAHFGQEKNGPPKNAKGKHYILFSLPTFFAHTVKNCFKECPYFKNNPKLVSFMSVYTASVIQWTQKSILEQIISFIYLYFVWDTIPTCFLNTIKMWKCSGELGIAKKKNA